MSRALQIKDYPEYYVTDNGDVYSRTHHNGWRIKKLSPETLRNGYLKLLICKNGVKKPCYVHRLVAETFIPNPDNKPEVNHKNGNKADNRVENLEWATRKENMQHRSNVLGFKGSKKLLGKCGKDCAKSKIVEQIKDGKVINEFFGTAEAYRETQISQGNISACCRGARNYAGGFVWRYKKSS